METPLLKGAHKVSHALSPNPEVVIVKGLGKTHLVISEGLPEGQEATWTPPGDIETGSSHFGDLFLPVYHEDTCVGKYHFGVLPLTY